MFEWMRLRRPVREPPEEKPTAPRRAMTGKYRLLYDYLEARYANTVVLTFAEIEDLLGFALPGPARLQREWWTAASNEAAGSRYSDSWILARRSAVPNLQAKTVVFERAA